MRCAMHHTTSTKWENMETHNEKCKEKDKGFLQRESSYKKYFEFFNSKKAIFLNLILHG